MTLEGGEKSKNIDTKSPCDSKSSHHEGSQAQGREDTTIPLLQGQSPALRSSAKATDPTAIKWSEREQKQQVQRARPLASLEKPARPSACVLPGKGENTLLCPRRLGLGGISGGPFKQFSQGKRISGAAGVQDSSSWGQDKLLGTGGASKVLGRGRRSGPEITPTPLTAPHPACRLPA